MCNFFQEDDLKELSEMKSFLRGYTMRNSPNEARSCSVGPGYLQQRQQQKQHNYPRLHSYNSAPSNPSSIEYQQVFSPRNHRKKGKKALRFSPERNESKNKEHFKMSNLKLYTYINCFFVFLHAY